jgi:4-amino-4-deoxy-L-arabinose transferase-like glycosyltransferase
MAAILVVYASLALFRLGSSDLGTDEGWFGVLGENIRSDPHQLALVAPSPLGREGGDKPYLYPLTLAGSIALFGRNEFALRIVSAILLMLSSLFLYVIVQRTTNATALAISTLVLFLLNPWTITYARVAMPEPLVLCCGCLAVAAAEKWRRTSSYSWAVLCGVALGLGFLAKLWLVAPFVAASAAVAINGRSQLNSRTIRHLVAGCSAFMLVAASHLVFVLLLAPQSFWHWMNIYFIFSLKSRASGTGYDQVMWFRPWWFYAATAFKACFFGLPLLFVGLEVLFRKKAFNAIAACFALMCPIGFFSVANVKQASYIYCSLPAIAFLVALGSVATAKGERRSLMWAAPASALIAAFFFAKGVFGVKELIVIEALYCGCLFFTLLHDRMRTVGIAVIFSAAGCIVLVADFLAVAGSLQHRTQYREIAAYMAPRLQNTDPRKLAFVAPEFPVIEFHTFRTGAYWGTFYRRESLRSFSEELRDGGRRFYIVDRSQRLYGSHMETGIYQLLRDHAHDVTAEIEARENRKLDVRVFESGASW